MNRLVINHKFLIHDFFLYYNSVLKKMVCNTEVVSDH